MTQKNEIQKGNNGGLALAEGEFNEMFGESHLEDTQNLSFNVIKIMRESAQFEISEGEYAKTLTGHILFKHHANQWWEVPFDERSEEDSPIPNCYSTDGIKPAGGDKVQSDLCATCPMNKFGSGKEGRGKACRNSMRFLFLADDAVLPVILMAPPTSLSKKGSLQHWLNDVPNKVAAAYKAVGKTTTKGGPIVDYWPAHVELTLEKEKYDSGMEASVMKIKTLDVVTPGTEENDAKLRKLFQIRSGATEAYQTEMQAYIEKESDLSVGAGNEVEVEDDSNTDEIPI